MTRRERDRANAHKLRADGLSLRQIAEQLDVPISTIGSWLLGEGGWFEIRNCKLCGVPFHANNPRQRFCTHQHASKYGRIHGQQRPSRTTRLAERVRELEAEVRELREALGR